MGKKDINIQEWVDDPQVEEKFTINGKVCNIGGKGKKKLYRGETYSSKNYTAEEMRQIRTTRVHRCGEKKDVNNCKIIELKRGGKCVTDRKLIAEYIKLQGQIQI